MNTNNGKPLIRKKYNVFSVVRMLFLKLSGDKNRSTLTIPEFAQVSEFRSLSTNQEKSNTDRITGPFGRERILAAMTANDIRGFGGAGFPMAEKLRAVLDSWNSEPVLIINGVECDPGLYHDKWILENKQGELKKISGILRDALGLSAIYLAKKTGTLPVNIDGVITVDIPDSYPAGEEKSLVSYILGIEFGDDVHPAEKGIWVQNVQSLLVLHSVLSGITPHRYLTMMDLDRKHATIVECDLDATIETLSDEIFGQYGPLYLGGGIMQAIPAGGIRTLDSGINLIAVGNAAVYSGADCRHCGQCTRHCMAELPVEDLVAEIENGTGISKKQQSKCRRCGGCSYVCPAGKDVCSLISLGSAN